MSVIESLNRKHAVREKVEEFCDRVNDLLGHHVLDVDKMEIDPERVTMHLDWKSFDMTWELYYYVYATSMDIRMRISDPTLSTLITGRAMHGGLLPRSMKQEYNDCHISHIKHKLDEYARLQRRVGSSIGMDIIEL